MRVRYRRLRLGWNLPLVTIHAMRYGHCVHCDPAHDNDDDVTVAAGTSSSQIQRYWWFPSQIFQRSVITLSRNSMSNASARIVNITASARNQVHVTMIYGLPCTCPIVHSDIESIHRTIL